MKKVNYLNNKDLLLEINKSKVSYCTFIDQKYQDYDIIIRSLDEINDELVQQGKKNRMERIAHFAHKAAIRQDKKVKLDEFRFSLEEISDQDVVIRLMTDEHIPRVKKGPHPTQFPPFKHYALDDNGNIMEVGRSHYKGDEFSLTHGKVTENLGRMYMMLVQRYSQRSNWRGYSYVDEMRGQAIVQLIAVGLKFDESKSQNPFGYLTTVCANSFLGILNAEKKVQNIRDDILESNGMSPSFTRQLDNDLFSQAKETDSN